jgi:hypothetical protein
VLDLRAPDAAAAAGVRRALVPLGPGARGGGACGCAAGAGAWQQEQHQHHQQQQQQQQQQHQLAAAYTFERHPGLVFFPGALPPAFQADLMCAALLSWPDPPAHTNHTAAYPGGLPGLLAAARAGLRSAAAPLADRLGPRGSGAYPSAAGAAETAAAEGASPKEEEQPAEPSAAGGAEGEEATARSGQGCSSSGCGRDAAGTASRAPSDSGGNATAPPSAAAWSPRGAGPPAADLLRRLRWVTLGPAFNWAARAYEPWRPYTPLPAELRGMALAFEAAARAAFAGPCADGGGGGDGGGDGSDGDGGGRSGGGGDAANGGSGRAAPGAPPARAPAAAPAAAAPLPAPAAPPPRRAYAPDAALVNYYRPGDTLGGHVDDAERDMAQPIVTASLGLDAVFLIGGESRSAPPTPLLLRGGDVLVLTGPARRSYHGVPRVFARGERARGPGDAGGPGAGVDAAEAAAAAAEAAEAAAGGDDAEAAALRRACYEHARGCRINISVRCIS